MGSAAHSIDEPAGARCGSLEARVALKGRGTVARDIQGEATTAEDERITMSLGTCLEMCMDMGMGMRIDMCDGP